MAHVAFPTPAYAYGLRMNERLCILHYHAVLTVVTGERRVGAMFANGLLHFLLLLLLTLLLLLLLPSTLRRTLKHLTPRPAPRTARTPISAGRHWRHSPSDRQTAPCAGYMAALKVPRCPAGHWRCARAGMKVAGSPGWDGRVADCWLVHRAGTRRAAEHGRGRGRSLVAGDVAIRYRSSAQVTMSITC